MFASALSFKWMMCFALLMYQYLCAKCWKKICCWQNENFPFESPKEYIYPTFHCPATSTDDEFIKKAITEFWCKDNSLCLRVFSNCSNFIAGCMLSLTFSPLLFFPSLFDSFFSGDKKVVSVAHLASMSYTIYSRTSQVIVFS